MKEQDIRPSDIFDEYLRLSTLDAEKYFSDKNTCRQNRECPACGKDDTKFEFEKLGFNYVRCNFCCSLYTNPCPEEELLELKSSLTAKIKHKNIIYMYSFIPFMLAH